MSQGAEEHDVQEEELRPDWLPEKFKSPEEMAQSYTSLERKLREQGQQMSDLEATVQHLLEREEEEPEYQPPVDPNDLLGKYEEALINGDARTAMAIQMGFTQDMLRRTVPELVASTMNQSREDNTVQDQLFARAVAEEARRKIGEDYEEIREPLRELLDDHPNLLPNSDDPTVVAESIAMAADLVRARRGTRAVDETPDPRQAKIAAQTLRGRGTGSEGEAAEIRDAIRDHLSKVSIYGYSR